MENTEIVVLLPETEPIETHSGCGGAAGSFGGTATM